MVDDWSTEDAAALSHPLNTVSPDSHISVHSLRNTGDSLQGEELRSAQKVAVYVVRLFWVKVAKGVL